MASCCNSDCDLKEPKNEFSIPYRDVLNKHYWNDRFLTVKYHGKKHQNSEQLLTTIYAYQMMPLI